MHAPFFGYLLFSHALQGSGVRFALSEVDAAAGGCAASVKVFALTGDGVQSMSQSGRTVRLVVINKDVTRACSVTLTVAGVWGDGYAVWLLPGPEGLMSKGKVRGGCPCVCGTGTWGSLPALQRARLNPNCLAG